MMHRLLFFIILFCCYCNLNAWAGDNKASLQRGAKLFINYCSGCHSLKYLRYNKMADGLGLDEELLKNNLIFTRALVSEPIEIALPPEDAKQWFGMIPPDLSLIVREKGASWLSNYLAAFYQDKSRPFGVNNHLVPDVAMPDILASIEDNNLMQTRIDLVAFLSYVSEPQQAIRHQIGWVVIVFLSLFFLVALGLKQLYWQKKQPKRLKM